MKKEIIQTSLEHFLKYGIRKVSVQKLVEPLGIYTKTIYKYFKNKEDLLEAALHLYYRQKNQLHECRVSEQNIVQFLYDVWNRSFQVDLQVNQKIFSDLLHYYPDLNERFAATTERIFTELFMRILKQGINEGFLKENLLPQMALDGMYELYTATVRQQHFKKIRISPHDLLINTMLIYVRCLCSENGRKVFNVQTYWPIGKSQKSNVKLQPIE